MTSRDFCYWLQGHFEISNNRELNAHQTAMIRNHLNLVFLHEIDPSMPDPDGKLQAAHDGNPLPPKIAVPAVGIDEGKPAWIGPQIGGWPGRPLGWKPGDPVMRC